MSAAAGRGSDLQIAACKSCCHATCRRRSSACRSPCGPGWPRPVRACRRLQVQLCLRKTTKGTPCMWWCRARCRSGHGHWPCSPAQQLHPQQPLRRHSREVLRAWQQRRQIWSQVQQLALARGQGSSKVLGRTTCERRQMLCVQLGQLQPVEGLAVALVRGASS